MCSCVHVLCCAADKVAGPAPATRPRSFGCCAFLTKTQTENWAHGACRHYYCVCVCWVGVIACVCVCVSVRVCVCVKPVAMLELYRPPLTKQATKQVYACYNAPPTFVVCVRVMSVCVVVSVLGVLT